MKINYAFDPQLKWLTKFRIPKIKLNRFLVGFANAACLLSCLFVVPEKGIKRKRYVIEGYCKKIALFCYSPTKPAKPSPCILYFHGGGFFLRDVGVMHKRAQLYSKGVNAPVLFVRYSLAPRFPFPAAAEDCYAALVWAAKNAKRLGIDLTKIAVAGDSAGGALAAAVCQMARDRGGPKIIAQALIYPVTDRAQNTRSIEKYADVPFWNSNLNAQMWALYLKDGDMGLRNYASPNSAADLSELPPAYIETAEFDCLHDEALNYAARLRDFGVSVVSNETKGTFHSYDTAMRTDTAKQAIAARIDFLNQRFCDS